VTLNQHADGTRIAGPRNGWACDLFEGGQKVGQVVIVRQSWNAGSRFLWDADARCYVPRLFGLGAEEVATP
jgi:hypothetical protein